jgi:hypothetical protein
LSERVRKEIERESSKRHPINSRRIDTAPPTRSFEYFLSESQWINVGPSGTSGFFSRVFHTHNAKVLLAKAAEIRTMDAIYLLMLAGLHVVTHGLVWALNRLGETS